VHAEERWQQEFLYKCACLIDEIAQTYTYDDFVEASTAARYQSLAGERGGVFRDPPQVRETAKRLSANPGRGDEAAAACRASPNAPRFAGAAA